MFGCIVAGRLIQTNLHLVDETHAVFELPSASTINHICVFLLGQVPFPEGYGATVHLHWPGKGFQLLGEISNDKPSAIFRLRGTYSAHPTHTHAAFSHSGASQDNPSSEDVTAILGISIEPLVDIQRQMSSLSSSLVRVEPQNTPAQSPVALAEKIARHLFNYLSSFADAHGTPVNNAQLNAVTRWYESFLAKLRAGGTGFLENQD